MKCENCGAYISPEDEKCEYCGTRRDLPKEVILKKEEEKRKQIETEEQYSEEKQDNAIKGGIWFFIIFVILIIYIAVATANCSNTNKIAPDLSVKQTLTNIDINVEDKIK